MAYLLKQYSLLKIAYLLVQLLALKPTMKGVNTCLYAFVYELICADVYV